MKHTPGPWNYQEESDAYTHIVRDSDGKYVCGCSQHTSGDAEANARLIAAAPELLAACKLIAAYVANGDADCRSNTFMAALQQGNAAIAKAEGRV